jgi:hypothetical protein
MADLLTISEIESKFPSEWVLIDEPQTDRFNHVVGGKVVFHSKDREEVYRQAIALPVPKRFAVRYTGSMPPDTATCLASISSAVKI